MSKYLTLLIPLLMYCQTPSEQQIDTTAYADPPDLNAIWEHWDSIDANGLHAQLAHELYERNVNLRSSEMYTTAAWLFGQANMGDSALICIDQAIACGMVNPNILIKHGLDDFGKGTSIRNQINHQLDSITLELSELDHFEIDTQPIQSFWSYFNQALADTLNARNYFKQYIMSGSPAVKDYYMIRYGNLDNMYQQMIITSPSHYTYTKNFLTDHKIRPLKTEVSEMMRKLWQIYPQAVFPKVYVMPGLLNSGGTATEVGMFIGGEMFVKSDSMAMDELTDWQKGAVSTLDGMKNTIMHELMHYQQSYNDDENMDTVLGNIIQEGVCDFLVEMCSGEVMNNDNLKYLSDSQNLEFILSDLKQELYSNDLSKWLYNGGSIEDRPHDLGYTLGYLIGKSYYQNSGDKEDAIYQLLNTNSYEELLRGSEYAAVLD